MPASCLVGPTAVGTGHGATAPTVALGTAAVPFPRPTVDGDATVRSIQRQETVPRPTPHPRPPAPASTGAREEEILDACVERAAGERLRPADHGRRRQAGARQQGHALPPLAVQAEPRRRRRHPLQADGRAGRARHRQPARRPARRCGRAGRGDVDGSRVLGVVITALQTDAEFAADFRARFLGPKVATTVEIYRRAAERGELRPGRRPVAARPRARRHPAPPRARPRRGVTPERVERVLDQIILPAATGRPPRPPPAHATPHLTEPHQETP